MKNPIVNTLLPISLTTMASAANSAVLTGSGLLPIPSPNDPINYVGPSYTQALHHKQATGTHRQQRHGLAVILRYTTQQERYQSLPMLASFAMTLPT